MVRQANDRRLMNPAALIAVAFSCLLCIASAAGLEARLDRESVPAGKGALLTLTISGRTAKRPEFPPVENLIVDPRGQSQQVQMFGGGTRVSTTYTFVVGSEVPGNYQIPAMDVMIDGEMHTTPVLHLEVLPAGAAQPPSSGAQQGQGGEEKVDETDEKRFGFLTVELADRTRDHAYLGEIAPVRIRAWLPPGARVRLHGGIQPENKGFTLHNVSQRPEETQEELDGKTYTVATWFGGISVARAGKIPASLSVEATVAIPDPAAGGQAGGPFGDPFFRGMFSPMIEKQVTLKSEDEEIEVRPLPTEGRPEGFSGAVGEFAFEGTRFPTEWQTGEPQQITTQIKGSGNFALMKAPALTPAELWKTYPGRDQFRASDEASFSGSKVFQFNAVPLKGGEQTATLSFSYFDPEAEAYKTITHEVEKIAVTGKDVEREKPAAAPETKAPEVKKPGELVAQHRDLSPAATLVPLVSRTAFKEMLGTSAGMALLGMVVAVVRRRRSDPDRLAKAVLALETRDALDRAGAANDMPTFFAAARLAIQRQLGALWNQPPQAITTAEVHARLAADSPVARFFREADHHEYNRRNASEVQPQWRALLDEAMASLTFSTR